MLTKTFSISPAAARLLQRAEDFLRQKNAWVRRCDSGVAA